MQLLTVSDTSHNVNSAEVYYGIWPFARGIRSSSLNLREIARLDAGKSRRTDRSNLTLTRTVSTLTIQSVLLIGDELRRVTPETIDLPGTVDLPETIELKVMGIGR